MRWSVITMALLSTACLQPTAVGADGPCSSDDSAACDPQTQRLLQCHGGRYEVSSDCKGAGGCTVDDQTVRCDASGNGAGDRCPTESFGKIRCEPDAGRRILRCADGVLTVDGECPAPTICGLVDGGLGCI